MHPANSPLVERLLASNVMQAEWVLEFLLAVFVGVTIVVLWKAVYFLRNAVLARRVEHAVEQLLRGGPVAELRRIVETNGSAEAEILGEALRHIDNGPDAFSGTFDAATLDTKGRLERGLVFLGNVGANAPFVGLFGTVLGVIRAFSDLSLDAKGGAAAVMAGISEALVATAVGLFVAIPAVLAFNYLQRQVKSVVVHAGSIKERVLVRLRQSEPEG
jgi:biopolymer transport protein ExbB/TolQ